MKMQCVELDGKVINIGPWDYMEEAEMEVVEVIRKKPIQGPGHPRGATVDVPEQLLVPKMRDGTPAMVATNPLPEGALVTERDVTVNSDGSRTVTPL